MNITKVAIVQKAPVFLDKEKSIALAVDSVKEAAANNPDIVIFTEAFIPGYPAWVWRLRPGGDWNLSEELYKRLFDNTVDMDSDDLLPLYETAREHDVTIVCGIEERDNKLSQSTIYNTVITIGADGTILN